MPKPLQYRAGSLIYFQGDAADRVFILQKGIVNLTYQDIETGADVHDTVQPGEFFGVKSALGRFPREENAMAMADTAVMVFTVPEFEALAMANTRIIMKMLKVFSNQMRRVHNQVTSLLDKEEEKPDVGLYNIGEYYLRNKRFSHAKYVFSRYLTYYPTGKNATQAAKNLDIAETSLMRYGDGKGPGIVVNQPGAQAASTPAPAAMPSAAPASSAGSAPDTGGSFNAEKAYFDAMNMVTQQKYQGALQAFNKIEEMGSGSEYAAKASFEMGHCMFLMGKFQECIKYYTVMLGKYPKHPDLKDVMFYIGQCHEKSGNKDQAAAFYKKILSMPGNENDGTIAKVKRALSALGA